jgi:hypothetical protein
MKVAEKKKTFKKSTNLIRVKKFKINTLVPNFKFKNKLGSEKVSENCYILI